MTAQATVRVLPAEEIAARAGGRPVPFRWPERTTLFAERAMRLRQQAAGHAMGDFLQFLSALARAQQAALDRLAGEAGGGVTLPDAAAIDRASMAGRPPLAAADGLADGEAWRHILEGIVAAMRREVPAGPAADALARLAAADEVHLQRQADALLTGVSTGLDLATAPIVAAALQVLWTYKVLRLVDAHAARGTPSTQPVGMLDDVGVCPCCGSRPVASITRSMGELVAQRYLHCSLCGTEWHLPRGRCAHCGETAEDKVTYQSLDRAGTVPGTAVADDADGQARAARAAIQAETCDTCGHYLKIVHGDREPLAEPVADDLASITLDLLVAETGKQRHGVNLMLLFGDPDAEPSPPAGGG